MFQTIKVLLKSNEFIYSIYSSYKNNFQNGKYNIVNKRTDICIEAYPSSANTFLQYLVKENYNGLNIAHHSHSIPNLKKAIRKKVPMIVIIRKPKDAISSRITRFSTNTRYAILEYKYFYEFVYKHKEDILVLNFEDVIKQPLKVLKDIRDYVNFDMNLNSVDNINVVIENVQKRIIEDEKDTEKLALPSDLREEKKQLVKSNIVEDKKFIDCEKVYKKLVSYNNWL
ncbi:sulfotransferase domain-containing protein [Virgibacillus sp. MSP4-1]|uniref:hypothetical protein n=1 Tax=Virgibacillus sp. MSP4-1 TaxID=2700081 RepID=UPI0003A45CCE|nr:hypothetical protein [Virgibacillus sp. MSP4-1]QHS23473.1 sulfotransferase domain-containing protein [Virgibacillus sp. MSP4-1]